MFSTIKVIFSYVQMQFGHSTHKWICFFTPLDVLIGVRVLIGEETFMTFDVHDDGRLNFTHNRFACFLFAKGSEGGSK